MYSCSISSQIQKEEIQFIFFFLMFSPWRWNLSDGHRFMIPDVLEAAVTKSSVVGFKSYTKCCVALKTNMVSDGDTDGHCWLCIVEERFIECISSDLVSTIHLVVTALTQWQCICFVSMNQCLTDFCPAWSAGWKTRSLEVKGISSSLMDRDATGPTTWGVFLSLFNSTSFYLPLLYFCSGFQMKYCSFFCFFCHIILYYKQEIG